ncbi:MAG: TonB-dependent receptor plug domain-containing protein, partial [Bacteroidota bacterium]
KDSAVLQKLDEVIVTGQHNPQSVKKSVFEVKVITREAIDQQAGNNLADLLNQTLNINIIPNSSSGKSTVSLFGLDAQYFKVLVDNIPLINEEGVGNNTDLTLINLDDIQQIEIVEGAMGVQYGSNAVSGIINIITKKSSQHQFEVNAFLQEETVGDEYGLFERGRHIQSIKIGHNFNNTLFGSAAYTRNDFGGFWDNRKGEEYLQNDGLRGHSWLPKEQHFTKLLLNYEKDNFYLSYKFDYAHETIRDYNPLVNLNENPATETTDPFALDDIYTNNRYYHHINVNGYAKNQLNYNISLSYQEQTKDLETYTYYIKRDDKENVKRGEYLSRNALFSRGTFSNLINTEQLKLQAGYELTREKGFGSPDAITIEPGEENVTQRLAHYDVFSSSELNLSNRTSFRPGVRVTYTNLFRPQYILSFSTKHLFQNNWELRTVIGSANRTPNYSELYTYFVDVNHNVQGNPELNPERGLSAFLHLKKYSSLADEKLQLKNKISLSYIDVKDRIELIVVNPTPLALQYNNIDRYTFIGIFSENTLQYDNIRGQLGLSFSGISKILNNETDARDDFLYNLQLNANLSYTIPEWNTAFSLYFKHVGRQYQFVEKTDDNGDQEFVRGETDPYSWMDTTIKTSFLDNTIEATLGVRNLLDVTSVNTTAFAGEAHSGPPAGLLLGYGRSYFLKLVYNLRI